MELESSPLILADREVVGPRGSIGGCRLRVEAFPSLAHAMEVNQAFKVTEESDVNADSRSLVSWRIRRTWKTTSSTVRLRILFQGFQARRIAQFGSISPTSVRLINQ